MEQIISYQAVTNSGTSFVSTMYWNGNKFSTVKANLKGDINAHFENAKKALEGTFIAMFPESYNFSIK